jgi:hypothetical protein
LKGQLLEVSGIASVAGDDRCPKLTLFEMVIENDQHGRRPERYVNIAEAKAGLSELVEKAASGEEIVFARDHEPVAGRRAQAAVADDDQVKPVKAPCSLVD